MCAICLLSAVYSPNATADKTSELSDNTNRLKQLRRQIADITQKLNREQKDQVKIHKQLSLIEKEIGNLVQKNLKTEQNMSQLKADLVSLEKQRQKLKSDLRGQQRILAKQIRAEYALGRHYPLKLMLTAHNPKTLSRNIYYLRHYSKVSASRLKKISAEIRDIDRLETAIKEQSLQLKESQLRYKQHKASLESQYQQRNTLLSNLDRRIEKKRSALQQLNLDQARLQKLIGSITESTQKIIPDRLAPAQGFAGLKGSLAWPVANRSGTQKRGLGLVILAEEGQPVHALGAGRVAYADWLRGYGLLIIIDHGDGYMTLYAYNQSLSKQLGDKVTQGEIIAYSGRSGGHVHAGVYFEIRHKGQAQNPMAWIEKTSAKRP